MDEAEFDKFAQEYEAMHSASVAVYGEGSEYFAEYKIGDIAREYAPRGEAGVSREILDFGSGIGSSVPYVQKYFPTARLTCLDVSRRSLEVAQNRFPSLAQYVHFDGGHIPFPEEHFDIVYTACVFHHVDHTEHVGLLRELHRVLRPGGTLFLFEHNPHNPLTVRIVDKCPFDEHARLISGRAMRQRVTAAGFATTKVRYRIFFPHPLRLLRPLERVLTWLPLGGQYCVLAQK